MERSEHLRWCKTRALEYVKTGDLEEAFASMISDLGKHEETHGALIIDLGFTLKIGGHLATTQQMKDWINGHN